MAHLQYSNGEGFGEQLSDHTHYSQAVRGWDLTTGAVPVDFGQQIDQAFANVEHILQHAGGKGWEQVYKVRCYFAPLDMADEHHLVRNLKTYCPNHRPILTAVGVEKLALENMKIEIEVVAHLGD
ncbi:hypothetical protein AJ80_00639 [Polytolypa hystricis UAMH7299]|uniref:Uncharacterized protein n=1 Tax=Polytolypa hystricis (strain UAMH7299) TaxID=1447883 RepID=A0A2B7Z121_POLH7|nr:hypothetical protein AJ80_00639 [Polytolypa hystricis UAMH7299]